MMRFATIAMVALCSVSFGALVPLPRLLEGLPSMTGALSIMAAAVLVRLNRGMPTLDWKSLKPHERRRLTQRIVGITGEYVVILSTVGILLVVSVSLTVIGKDTVVGTSGLPGWPPLIRGGLSAVVGGLLMLTLLRMGYVVWRDYDIVRLQKTLLDDAGRREEQEEQAQDAKARLADMQTFRISTAPIPPPASWEAP